MTHLRTAALVAAVMFLWADKCPAQRNDSPHLSTGPAKEAVLEFNTKKSQLIEQRKTAEKKLENTFEAEFVKLRDGLVAKLETLLDGETKNGNLDGALEIREAIRSFKEADASSATPAGSKTIKELREQVRSLKRDLAAVQSKAKSSETKLAQLEIVSGASRVGVLQDQQRAFSNRKYVWASVPDDLPFSRVTTVEGGGKAPLVVKVIRDGWVSIAVQHEDGKVPGYIKQNGWQRTEHEFAYTDHGSSKMYVFRKQVRSGTLTFPRFQWSGPVVLLP